MVKARCLIAFFSRRGNNYVNGRIVNLPVGNTEAAALAIRKLTGGDLFRIDPVKEYPADYEETTEVAKQELCRNARPELSAHVVNMDEYGVIFLGYPNWWGTMPMAWKRTVFRVRPSSPSAPTRGAGWDAARAMSRGFVPRPMCGRGSRSWEATCNTPGMTSRPGLRGRV